MPARKVVLKAAIAGTASLLLLAGLLAWLDRRTPAGLVETDGGEAAAGKEAGPPEAASGNAPSPPVPLPLDPAQTKDLSVEVLDLGEGECSISGTVFDPTGKPAAGFEVVLFALDASDAGDALRSGVAPAAKSVEPGDFYALVSEPRATSSPRVVASPEGRFAFRGVRPSSFRLLVWGAGVLRHVSALVEVDAERPSTTVELRLASSSIRGIVLAPGGSPVEAARVDAFLCRGGPMLQDRNNLGQPSATARSDSEGRFLLEGLDGASYALQVTRKGFGGTLVPDAPVGETLLRIVLQSELFLRGEVVDGDAQPIQGAEVRLIYLDPDGSSGAQTSFGNVDFVRFVVRTARTESNGQFTIGELARGVYRAEVQMSGYASAVAPFVNVHESNTEEESRLFITLEEGLEIRGVVRDEGGKPLGAAPVRARYLGPLPSESNDRGGSGTPTKLQATRAEAKERTSQDPLKAQTAVDGTFELNGLWAGLYEIGAASPQHRPRVMKDVAAGGELLEIELEAASPCDGVVIDRQSRQPVARAMVRFRRVAENSWPTDESSTDAQGLDAAFTDAEGRFRLKDLPQGLYAFRVEAEGYQTLETKPIDRRDVAELMLEVDRGGTVNGTVRAPPRSPMEGLSAFLVPEDEEPRRLGRRALTDARGSYSLPLTGAGSYQVIIEGQPYVSAKSRVFVVQDARARIEGVDIDLQLGATVRGIAIGPDRFPVVGAIVSVVHGMSAANAEQLKDQLDRVESKSASANASGEFEVEGLAAGLFRAVARAPGFVSARSEDFELAPGGTRVIEITMEPELTLAGTIQSPEGEPIALAEIHAAIKGEKSREYWSEETTRSSTLGTYRLSRLANRLYDVRATAEGFASVLLRDVRAGRNDVHLRAERLVRLTGKVVGAFSGEAAEEYRLRLEAGDPERLSPTERKYVNDWREFKSSDGSFDIDDLPPGRYTVKVEAPGFLGTGDVEIELAVGEGLADAIIPLREAGLLAGTVLDGRANPAGGVSVQALRGQADPVTGRIGYVPYRDPRRAGGSDGEGRRESGGGRRGGEAGERERAAPSGRVETRSDGQFFLRGLPDGLYRLSFTHNDFVASETGDYVLENGVGDEASVGIRVFLDSGATLRGSVRSRSAVESMRVALMPNRASLDPAARRGSSYKVAQVDEAGHFEIRGLAVGEYRLTLSYRRVPSGESASVQRTVQIRELQEEKGIVIDLSR